MFKKSALKQNITNELSSAMHFSGAFCVNTIIICIGSNKIMCDSLGPYVGTYLQKNDCKYPVFGTLKNPINALNIESSIKKIRLKYPNAHIIAIDACISRYREKGVITFTQTATQPGSGVGKNLPEIGNYSIQAVIDNVDDYANFKTDNSSVTLREIRTMAKTICDAIISMDRYTSQEKIVSPII